MQQWRRAGREYKWGTLRKWWCWAWQPCPLAFVVTAITQGCSEKGKCPWGVRKWVRCTMSHEHLGTTHYSVLKRSVDSEQSLKNHFQIPDTITVLKYKGGTKKERKTQLTMRILFLFSSVNLRRAGDVACGLKKTCTMSPKYFQHSKLEGGCFSKPKPQHLPWKTSAISIHAIY